MANLGDFRLACAAAIIVAATMGATGPALAQSWPTLAEAPPATGGGERDAALVISREEYTLDPTKSTRCRR